MADQRLFVGAHEFRRLGTPHLKIGLNTVGTALLSWTHRHPKRIAFATASVLLGAAASSFAVATLAPDASDLPVRQVLEAVQPLPLPERQGALDLIGTGLFRSDVTRSTDTPVSLMGRLGINDAAAASFLASDASARQSLLGRAGRSVTAQAGEDNRLTRLTARWGSDDDRNFKRLVIERTPKGLVSRIETAALTTSSRLASGTIRSSLFAATDDARIPDAVATQVAEIFSGDIDFHRALRKGDRFSIVYETLEADGEPIRSGRVLGAEFVNNGKTYQALWFQEPGLNPATGQPNKGGYYTADGQSLHRAYLASPLAFSRISSGFQMRFHPILQTWRAHLGVDYAAPTGTPVRTVGEGVVDFAGVQNGFGNVVMVKHRNGQTTVYAHLSRINVRKGQNVGQGENVGLVGSTGWATGPHLHFEFRINGVHHDPLTIARQSESVPVSTAARPVFDRLAALELREIAAASSMQQGSAE
jgi:murein DD-endopeptidase MepM/ murein hydrolase activator NlpD